MRALPDAPEGQPIKWLLLTTVAVDSVEDARECIPWYACRGGSEVWHRMLTSGAHLAARQWATDERLTRDLTRSRLMAWRVFDAMRLARAVPEISCDVLWAVEEGQARYGAIPHCPILPARPPSLGEAVRWSAPLGGFVARRRWDQPGAETWWRGWQHFTDLTTMYRMMRPCSTRHEKMCPSGSLPL